MRARRGERGRLLLGRRTRGCDLGPRGLQLVVERDDLGLRLLELCELELDLVAQPANTRGEVRVGGLDPLEVLDPGREVLEAVGLQKQRRGVGVVALVDRDEAVAERVEGALRARRASRPARRPPPRPAR